MQHLPSFAYTNKNGIYYDNIETQNVIKLIMISSITKEKSADYLNGMQKIIQKE